MANEKWRRAVLERDDRQCQFSKLFGISELSGVPCSDSLQVHHNTYVRYGHEKLEDGITVCTRCHDLITDLIRSLRYNRESPELPCPSPREIVEFLERSVNGEILETQTQERETILFNERKLDDGKLEIQDHGRIAPDLTQRFIGRPAKPLHPPNQGNQFKAEEG